MKNNLFQGNMAYFSGNAVYIRNTVVYTSLNQSMNCGGVNMINNNFINNFGMKVHNGGAVSAYCFYITNVNHQDFYATSNYTLSTPQVSYQYPDNSSVIVIQSYADQSEITIQKMIFNIEGNYFNENFSGGKGTALYVRQMSNVKVYGCIFTNNAPVYAVAEDTYSPYTLYISGRPMSFYDSMCVDEYQYLQQCYSNYQISDVGGVQWSIVQGALYVNFCQDVNCLNSNVTQILQVSDSNFAKNLAGPVLDASIVNIASQICVVGGFQILIQGSQFFQNQGSDYIFSNQNTSSLTSYFPPGYMDYSMAPLINILMTPAAKVTYNLTMNATIQTSKFYQNKNIQVQALSTGQDYWGSLIQMQNLATAQPQNQQVLLLTVEDCVFNDNQFTGSDSSLIYTYQILTQILRNTFVNNGRITNNVYSNQRSQYSNYVTSPNFNFLSYTFNDQQQYGCVWIQNAGTSITGLTHLLQNNTFKYNFAYQGVAFAFYANDNQQVRISGNKYSFMFAKLQGSIMFWEQNNLQATVLMQNENSSFLFAKTYGAIRITPIVYNQINLLLYNSSYQNTYANVGQGISVSQLGKVLVQNVNYSQPNIPNGMSLKNYTLSQFKAISLPLINFFISPDIFTSLTSGIVQSTGFIDLENVQNTPLTATSLSFNGTIIQNSTYKFYLYAEIINCNFLGNTAQQYAAVYGYSSYIRIANQLSGNKTIPYYIANNAVQSSGAVGAEYGSTLVGENLRFINNTANNSGSALYLSQSIGNMTNTTFTNNSALLSGTIIVEGNSKFDFTSCSFVSNYASDTSVLFAQNNPYGLVTFSKSSFVNNTSGMNTISLLYSSASFNSSTFIDNIANSVNHGLTLISSSAYLYNVTINYTNKNFLYQITSVADTGFFNLNYQSTMTINNSTISNCRGALASVLYLTGQSQVNLINHTTISQSLSTNGDVILATLARPLYVDQVTFSANSQSDIKLQQTSGNVTNSRFINSGSNSIVVTSSSINLINNTFQADQLDFSNAVQEGGALYCSCQGQTVIANNTFQNIAGDKGGALYLSTSLRTVDQIFLVDGNTFLNNGAQQGGAIYLQDSVIANITRNRFDSNQANLILGDNFAAKLTPQKGQAGAIYLSCEINGLLTQSNNSNINVSNCVVNINLHNTFKNNSADDGGAILWTAGRPNIDASNIFTGNNASYGIDIASYPGSVKMLFITNNDYVNTYNDTSNSQVTDSNGIFQPNMRRRLQDNNSSNSSVGYVPPLVSGNTMDFNIVIVDQDGTIYRTDSASKAVLGNQNSSELSVILLNNQQIAEQGVYYFRNVEFIAPPGTDTNLQLSISGLSAFGNNVNFINTPVSLSASTRTCIAGEQQTAQNQCIVCPPGTFQYYTPNSTTPCQTCPPNADCYGMTTVAPTPGYWRSSNTSTNFDACPNPAACLGGNSDYPLGQCAAGYQGIVCGDCAPNYSSSKQFSCKGCPNPKQNLIQIVLILVAVIFVVAFLVKSTLDSADKKKPVYAVYLKIMANHFQILGAISTIQYNWPTVIQQFEDQQNTVSSASNQIFSVDCFLDGSSSNGTGIAIFYQKLIMYALLPVILTLVCLLFWFVVGRIQKKTLKEVGSKFISTVIVVLFLVHPNIATQIFLTFNCQQIDGVYRMKQDLSSICYQGTHMFYVVTVAVPSMILWIMGIPLFALLLLVKNKRIINLMGKKQITAAENKEVTELKMKYGFLFSGYDVATFFWEVMLMFRKILIIASSVFLSTISSESQVLVVIFIIVVSMFLHIRCEPYYTHTLNKMESYSLQVAAVTVYTGMYYITGESFMNNQIVSWFFLVCIVLPNLVFVLYWVYNMRIELIKEIYRRKLHHIIIRIVACSSPESFYSKHMKEEDELAEKNKQIIIDDVCKAESKEEVRNTLDGAQLIGEQDLSSNTIDEFRTERSTVNKVRAQKRNQQYTENIPSTARSFKVFPESAIGTERRDLHAVIEEGRRPDYSTPEEEGPQHFNFVLDDRVMRNKLAQNQGHRSKKIRDRYGINIDDPIEEEIKSPSSQKKKHRSKKIRNEIQAMDSEQEETGSRAHKKHYYKDDDLDIDSINVQIKKPSMNSAFALTLKQPMTPRTRENDTSRYSQQSPSHLLSRRVKAPMTKTNKDSLRPISPSKGRTSKRSSSIHKSLKKVNTEEDQRFAMDAVTSQDEGLPKMHSARLNRSKHSKSPRKKDFNDTLMKKPVPKVGNYFKDDEAPSEIRTSRKRDEEDVDVKTKAKSNSPPKSKRSGERKQKPHERK